MRLDFHTSQAQPSQLALQLHPRSKPSMVHQSLWGRTTTKSALMCQRTMTSGASGRSRAIVSQVTIT